MDVREERAGRRHCGGRPALPRRSLLEPTGIEPVTSCLQSARGSGRLRVKSGCLRVAPGFQRRSGIPGAEVCVFEDSAHMMFIEERAGYVAAIEDFLKRRA